MSLEQEILNRIKNSPENTFIPKDFLNLSDRGQVQRVLRKLLNKNIILRVGQGIYTEAKVSSLTKRVIPKDNLRTIAITVLQKNGIKIYPTNYETDHHTGKSNQVPTGLVIGVDRRISKKIGFNGRYIKFVKVISSH